MYERARQADPCSPVPLCNSYYLCAGPLRDPPKAEAAARALVTLEVGGARPTARSTSARIRSRAIRRRSLSACRSASVAVLATACFRARGPASREKSRKQ